MTPPNMKLRAPALLALTGGRTYLHLPPSAGMAAPRTDAPQDSADARVAARDDDQGLRKWDEIRNPLWVIAIGMAFLFTAMALVVALG